MILNPQTNELVEVPPVKDNRVECPVCHKLVRTYTVYHVARLSEHRGGDYFTWCDGGNKIVTENT
jgi:hypothetical protein